MKQRKNIWRERPWLILLALFAWLLPQQAAALSYEDDPDNYSVELGGSNVIYFTAPCYDTSGADTWIYDGNLRVSVDGADPITIFHWESKTDIDNDKTTLPVNFTTTADGFFDITLGNSRNTFRLTKNNGGWKDVVRNSDGKTFGFSAEWAVPYNLLGKKLRFTWYVKRNGNSATVLDRQVPGLQAKEISMPAASAKLEPFVSLPMLSANNPGKLEIPWFLASDSIVSAHYEYTDDTGKRHEEKIEKVKSSSILLDANVPYRNFRVVCSYKEASDKGSYLIENQGSAVQNIPVIHTPVGLTARQLDGQDLKVEVKWNIVYPDDEDLTPTDFFEVQRSITGEEKDFVTIQQLPYISVSKQSTYTFVDNTLMDDITPDMLVNGGTLDKLTYRVRRTITKDWNWAKNTCSSTKCVVDNLHLLRIANYSADWEDKNAYTVRVSWNYADEHGAVWDERAQMVLRVMSRNKAGAVVDSLIYNLDQNDRTQRYKIVNLTRSCVNYDIEMYVEKGESPINDLDQVENYFFSIRSVADWLAFNQKVEDAKGKYDVNARLYADIATDAVIGWNSSSPYRGVFDGNGHTLTVNYSGSANSAYNNRFIAPFRYVGNATIMNLHVAGTISTNERNVAGLIADANDKSTIAIENCRSSVTIKSSYNGATDNGGFIGRQSGATVIINNCKFDGAFEGENSAENGGFVGWVARGSTLSINNSLFAPDHLTTKGDKCDTWAVLDNQDVTYSLVNSYATREFSSTVLISNADDWTTFRNKVEEAKGQYDVNAILTADITVTGKGKDYIAGYTANYPYRGTFDGNGHTLNLNISDDAYNTGLFSHVANATFKNVKLTGTISCSKSKFGSLIGCIDDNYSVTFENCQSSVTLKSSVNGDGTMGGFVGALNSNAKATFRNCKFDGSFDGPNTYANGGYVGWTNGPITFENCLFTPASVNTDPRDSETWARNSANQSVSYTNCYATKEFIHVINNFSDWEEFRKAVDSRGNHSVNAILNADISANTSISGRICMSKVLTVATNT